MQIEVKIDHLQETHLESWDFSDRQLVVTAVLADFSKIRVTERAVFEKLERYNETSDEKPDVRLGKPYF